MSSFNKNAYSFLRSRSGKVAVVFLFAGAVLLISIFYILNSSALFAFEGPGSSPGVGVGAIAVDESNNLSAGTSTVLSDTRLYILGGNSTTTAFAIQLKNQEGRPLFVLRNDGRLVVGPFPIGGPPTFPSAATLQVRGLIETVSSTNPDLGGGIKFPDGTIQTTAGGGSTILADNVSAGDFGANTGGSDYTFPANVAIGTTTISGRLNIQADQNAVTDLNIKNKTAGTGASVRLVLSNDTASVGVLKYNSSAQTTNPRDIELNNNDAAGDIRFFFDGLFNVVFADSGMVGIGTTTPSYRLDVQQGSAGTLPGINIVETNTTSRRATMGFGLNSGATTGWIIGQSSGNNTTKDFYLYDATAGLNRLVINTSGNIGIGTSTPAGKLTLSNNLATGFLDNYSEYQVILWDAATASGSYGLGIKNGTIVFNSGGGYSFDRTGNATSLAIDGSGRVGVGIASPTSTLDVSGVAGSAGQISLQVRSGNSSANFASNQITFGYNNSAQYRHAIKSRHHGSQDATNAIDFFVWDFGTDAADSIGTKRIMSVDSGGYLDLNSNRIINLATPTAAGDAATKGYVDSAIGTSSVMWAGYTTTTYNGGRGSWKNANSICEANYASSVFADFDDIRMLGNRYPYGTTVWLNILSGGANDGNCEGWTSQSSLDTGVYVDTNGYIDTSGCNNAYNFACVYRMNNLELY